ncbi:MAG: hypothetical protein H0T42_16660 [Deltaproteobacteria bacterium]|nr:hypothetical protein [Deltaproteobacteria bacterium]
MSTKLLAIAASLALTGTTACVGEDPGNPPSQDVPRPMNDEVPLSALATPDFPEDERPEAPEEPRPEGCELTVATDGACSVACFPELVIDAYVPEGTCAMFECDLRTGGTIQVGGCHL